VDARKDAAADRDPTDRPSHQLICAYNSDGLGPFFVRDHET
jgi:hypothetical protein